MKKDLKTLNKSVAIAIAAAMTATSAPTPLLASDFTDGGDFVSESPAAEADTTEEAAVEADGFGDEAAVAAVTESFLENIRRNLINNPKNGINEAAASRNFIR